MSQVLRHYLPRRKLLLLLSETVLLSLVIFAGLSAPLWGENPVALDMIWRDGLSQVDARWRCLLSSITVALLTQVSMSFNELYDFRISASRFDRASRFIGSAGTGIAMALTAVVITRLWGLERIFEFPGLALSKTVVLLTFSLLFGFVLLFGWRVLFHWLMRQGNFNDRVLVLGVGDSARDLVREIEKGGKTGHEIVGVVGIPTTGADRRSADGGSFATEPQRASAMQIRLHRVDDKAELVEVPTKETLPEIVARLNADSIAVALSDSRGTLPVRELLAIRLAGVIIEESQALFERVTGKIPIGAMRPSYLIFNRGFSTNPTADIGKRILDIVLALAVFAVSWPAMLLTALFVRLDSPGPVLFRQERCGHHGRPFTLLKFRSMRADAEASSGPVWAQSDDPRITPFGKFIRKTRLDELPQVFNILLGDMSMVGPRPERPHFVDSLAQEIPYFNQRHIVKPGLTGWAQINYPYGNTVEDSKHKLQYDLFYIKHQSLLLDLSILFSTIKTVVLRKGT
ncbi:MAG: TIGR03013 family PEP-CTERM/XrtA system glycosyltransferase [Planctomycetota bacterium]|nr:TIGR03013 family PEP-CTERM/XrtA system glycosyltransferase [Planctomycetota bacterium]